MEGISATLLAVVFYPGSGTFYDCDRRCKNMTLFPAKPKELKPGRIFLFNNDF